MNFRHEWKHEINYLDVLMLRMNLPKVMDIDSHAIDGKYEIRSLYFDNLNDKALKEKIDGVNKREKFRIRLYNGDNSFILLEKKSKINYLCSKESAVVTADEVRKILEGDILWMIDSDRPLVRELYLKMLSQGLRPRSVVEYTREPFVYGPGNVRVTIDYNIRTSVVDTNILDPDLLTIPAGDRTFLLEVKWDEYLPENIKAILSISGRRASAFSKYARCRIYG